MRTDNLVIGFGGYDRAGKDTVAKAVGDYLRETTGVDYVIVGMSDTLKEIIYAMNPRINLRNTHTTYREELDYLASTVGGESAYEIIKDNPDVRRFLRTMGNVVGRQIIDPNIWAVLAGRAIAEKVHHVNVMVTGIRHPSDLGMLDEFPNSTSVWVHREGISPTDNKPGQGQLTPTRFKYGVTNSGTISELKRFAVPALVKQITMKGATND